MPRDTMLREQRMTTLTPEPMMIGGREFRWGTRTFVMGIVNATPDSFSGDGLQRTEAIATRARAFADAGADILDVGGESTRPGAAPVSVEDESRRIIPALQAASAAGLPMSIDTYKSDVARAALRHGACMINDIWGLQHDPRLGELAAQAGVPLALMHNQHGTEYRDLIPQVIERLARSVDAAIAAGVPRRNILVDPGFGFGKTAEQNLELLRRLGEMRVLGLPILIGTSRKSTIGLVLDLPVEERLEGTAATVAIAIANGADMVRVHDVREMTRVARMSDAIVRGWTRPR